jgi:hypothetical protein
MVCFFKICFDMGDDRPERLHQHAVFEARRQGHLQFLATLEAMGQGGVPAGGVDCFGGFEVLFEPLCMWTGRGTSVQPLPPASMGRQIPSSFCGSTPSPFVQLEAMGASWRIGP